MRFFLAAAMAIVLLGCGRENPSDSQKPATRTNIAPPAHPLGDAANKLERNEDRVIEVKRDLRIAGMNSRRTAWYTWRVDAKEIVVSDVPVPPGTVVACLARCGKIEWFDDYNGVHSDYSAPGIEFAFPSDDRLRHAGPGPGDVAIRDWVFETRAEGAMFTPERWYVFCFDAKMVADGRSKGPACDFSAALSHLIGVIELVPSNPAAPTIGRGLSVS